MNKYLIISILIFVFAFLFFSYRLSEVPEGITIDEAAFGYNAVLISETLHDENGRFLPVFVLSLDGRDWRQPIAQYADVLSFKIFGRSLFNLKLVSVLTASLSALLIFILGSKIFNLKFGLISFLLFLTVPIVLIHSHLALDNITPVPFILLWLLGIVIFIKTKKLQYLIIAGIFLGIGFYAHKSMRSAAPIWSILTVLYLFFHEIKNKKLNIKNYLPMLIFSASIFPFYLAAPILDYKYAGAVFGSQTLNFKSVYDFAFFYISNFDFSFLFIKGDSILHHSTGIHGMFLLSSFPLFIYGIYKSVQLKDKLFIFLIMCFFAGPLMISFVGSEHRASRIIFLVPLFCLISALGINELLKLKIKYSKNLLVVFLILFIFNFLDFVNYYWYKYPEETKHIFYSTENINTYKQMYNLSRSKNLRPLISSALFESKGDSASIDHFAMSLYFPKPEIVSEDNLLPANSILITSEPNLKGENRKIKNGDLYLYIKD